MTHEAIEDFLSYLDEIPLEELKELSNFLDKEVMRQHEAAKTRGLD